MKSASAIDTLECDVPIMGRILPNLGLRQAYQTVRSTLASVGRDEADAIVRAIAEHLVARLNELGKVSSN